MVEVSKVIKIVPGAAVPQEVYGVKAVLMARSSATDEMPGKNPTPFTY